jgi:carbon storage regulator
MLVLSRKNGQKIIINDNIEITILESKFDNCKIAINAPKEVKIYREEVYKQIQFSNKMSNKASVDAIDSLVFMVNKEQELPKKVNKIIIKKKEA